MAQKKRDAIKRVEEISAPEIDNQSKKRAAVGDQPEETGLRRYILSELQNLRMGLTRYLDGLTHQELMWRPSSGQPSIGLILFHIARLEDTLVQAIIMKKPELWDAQRWYVKLKLAQNINEAFFTVEDVNSFDVPDGKDLAAYFNAVRDSSIECVKSFSSKEFDRQVALPVPAEGTVAIALSVVVGHMAQKMGGITYLRGLQRGADLSGYLRGI
jgi:hypothetical protein